MQISEEIVSLVNNALIKRFQLIIQSTPFIKKYLGQFDDKNLCWAYIDALTTNVSLVYARHYVGEQRSEPCTAFLESLDKQKNQSLYKFLKANNMLNDFHQILKECVPIWIDQYKKDDLNLERQDVEKGKQKLIEDSKEVFEKYENHLFTDIFGHSEFKEFLKRNKIKDINGAIITIIHKYLHEIYKGTKNPKFITLLNVCDEETIEYRQRFLEEIMNNQKTKDDFNKTFIYMIKQLNKWYKVKRK